MRLVTCALRTSGAEPGEPDRTVQAPALRMNQPTGLSISPAAVGDSDCQVFDLSAGRVTVS